MTWASYLKVQIIYVQISAFIKSYFLYLPYKTGIVSGLWRIGLGFQSECDQLGAMVGQEDFRYVQLVGARFIWQHRQEDKEN